ncbi:DUF5712 family protein [Chryseobacterium sp. JM1]|uniref:DUF5712 family protein n=1 Tax=Chryseobacterium sp. JM1 TaxID=1233950 RepID=UPI000554B49F|nr:DUF5712 family protein [Chryseobacterium sp. JM1]
MYINITDSETGNNKASCGQLVQYLEKENRTPSEDGREQELWFSTARRDVIHQEVRVKIDNNIAKLGKNDAKFFLVNISPSQKEIAFLRGKFGDQGAEDKLKEFAIRAMDAYAQNFRRTGIEGSKDLLWYGKLEHFRYYSHKDPEVKQELAKVGQRKEGEQMHIQVIVSRKDITNKIKLSPMNNSRGKNEQHSAKVGQFDRLAFKGSGESLFDSMFSFERELKDTMNYALIMKNGNAEEKKQIYNLQAAQNKEPECDIFYGSELFDISFLPDSLAYEQPDDMAPNQKKRKKKRSKPQSD